MAKIRVLDVAQEELEKEKLLAKLKKMGVKVKDEEMAEQGTPWGATERIIRDEEGGEFIEKRIKPTVIRRRAKAIEEPEKIPEEVQQGAQEAVQGEVAEVLEEEAIGIISDPTPEAFESNILDVYRHPDKYLEMVRRGNDYVKKWLNHQAFACKFLELITQDQISPKLDVPEDTTRSEGTVQV